MKHQLFKDRFIALAFVILFSYSNILCQTKEADAFSRANSLKDPHKKIEAFQKFVKDFPTSHRVLTARYYIFTSYLNLKSEKDALKAADNIIQNTAGGTQINMYNSLAFGLAQKNMGVKTARKYIDKALRAMQGGNPRVVKMFQDTKALVMYNLGYPDSALALEKKAIVGNETSADYLNALAKYQNAAGMKKDALISSAKAVLYGDASDGLKNFNKWLPEFKKTKNAQEKFREETTSTLLTDFQKNSQDNNKVTINSNAAVFMAHMNVNLDKAHKWAEEAVKSIDENTSIEDIITYKTNLTSVLSSMGKNQEALNVLTSVEKYVVTWNSNFWYTLGKVYEKLNKNDKALKAYVDGLLAFKPDNINDAATALLKKENKDENLIDKYIDKRKKELNEFEPGKFDGKDRSGRVVLAELFTGAECPPCVAADKAFDKLSEYYPRNVFTVLEYHIHIPGPDPLTNPQTFQRYRYYGGNFGTPTMFFDGQNKLTGGGPDYIASNRFKVFNYIIKQQMAEKPGFDISGNAKLNGQAVDIKLKVKSANKNSDASGKSLHIALVEKSIDYTGGNGVSNQIFVVRHLVDGVKGSPLMLKNNSESVNKTLDLANIQSGIVNYLNDPTKDPSWRGKFNGWRARPDKLNHHNLAIVAWVQDNNTKAISQAYYTDVRYKMSEK